MLLEVIHSLKKIPEKTCVALGFFDGVHMGHKRIIESMVSKARSKGTVPVVFTFLKSPQEILKGKLIKRILSEDDKELTLSSLGVGKIYAIDFSKIMRLSADEFISQVLIDTLNASDVFCGFNYHFGAGKAGDCTYLKQRLALLGIDVHINEAVNYLGEPVSSTRIRKLIAEGSIEQANLMLARNFGFKSKAVECKKLKRNFEFLRITQGFPREIVLPRFGAYKTKVKIKGIFFDSITNIDARPIVSTNKIPLVETFILNYSGSNLCGEIIELEFLKFLSAGEEHSSLVELKKDICNLICGK